MKRLRIEHVTEYTYAGDVRASYNEARMLPGTTQHQFVLTSSLDVRPDVTVNSYIDYFGTRVSAFDALLPHSALTLTARSLVEVRPWLPDTGGLPWDRLQREAERSVATLEQLGQTDRTRPHEEVLDIARSIAGRADDPTRAAREIALAVGGAVAYDQNATEVVSTATDSWERRRGVCQDIAHITLGALRGVGIPARYISGYLHPVAEPEVGVSVAGESHAWVEWFNGDWRGFDPTNDGEIDDRYVRIGHGRDYNDVPPLRGVYDGTTTSELRVEVTVTREE